MTLQTKPNLLAVGVAGLRPHSRAIDLYVASTLREAIATIRLVCFDLVLVGLDDPKLDVWELMHRILAAWPHQRWILAAREITNDEEVQARSMGALMVLSDVPDEHWLVDFSASLRRRDLSKSIPSLASTEAFASSTNGMAMQVEAP